MSSQHQQGRHRRPYKGGKFGDDVNDEQPNSSQTRRRKQAAISLASFSSKKKKGHDWALQEYKRRKETKFQKNASLLREYQKAMKQEGYEVGKGASRKRGQSRDDGDADTRQTRDGKKMTGYDEEELQTTATDNNKPRKKRHKSDPLQQARKEAEIRKAEQLELISQKERRKKTEGQKQQHRKVRSKKMMQRTRRGQPLMKNVIGDLLGKIKSDVGEGAWSGILSKKQCNV